MQDATTIFDLQTEIDRLRKKLAAAKLVVAYADHDSSCPLARWQAGEPTPNGGYRVKYADRWYDTLDDVPCECGLKNALTIYDQSKEGRDE